MLASRGHIVSGIALDPLPGCLFERAGLSSLMENDERLDIRDAVATVEAVSRIAPDVVFHLAAQPLVRESYLNPLTTFETNAMGTLNLLHAVSETPSVKAHVVVTTDKVYRNVDQVAGYVESDALGGDDPYSASKAMADILTQSWVKSFPGVPTAIARAGNVIGGGDVSKDRLLPDLLGSFAAGVPAHIRYPEAVRPWQHVLDCLDGYIALSNALLKGNGQGQWNFAPDERSFVRVREIADIAVDLWGESSGWVDDSGDHPHEANLLALDATKAQTELGWHNRLSFDSSIRWTVEWERAVLDGEEARAVTEAQIAAFQSLT